MRSFLLTLTALLLGATVASAQPTTSYTFKVFNQGATAPFTTATLSASNFVCGQSPKITLTGTQVNPTKIAFDDPSDATKDCVYVDSGTGPLLALPFALQVYTATIAAVDIAGTSADSGASNPFSHPGLPPIAPTGLRVGR